MSGEKFDILIGIASYNNAKTIGHVVRAVDAGLKKYFPDKKGVIVNSDGGSKDGTTDVVRSATIDHAAVFLSHPVYQIHRITMPYNGIPGKGSAFKAIFQKSVELGAEACCVVDADLRSITPEWIELLLSPVIKKGFDFVAPLYSRHKYDGTITNSIVYPMTRALYGKRLRQPIGGEFGFSGKLAEFYLKQDVWESHVARFGIDIWMTTEAVANNFKVCQTFLGAKLHDPKDPGADLADMLVQVVVTLFNLAEKHFEAWKGIKGSEDVPTFGFKYHVGLEPVKVNMERMLDIFRTGIRDLKPIWVDILGAGDFGEIEKIGSLDIKKFRFPSGLWAIIIYDYALAYHKKKMSPEHLIKSLVPMYLGRTASFVIEAENMDMAGADAEIEKLCMEFEQKKEYLINSIKGVQK
ncbi:MAG: glycosyl transferase family 2 [Deltaproteobacteria bacterium GWC2_42_11]|nr:MAG: glycosyl transferase family 2 [Deltaproteobacteria bacterium GWC2_42_11]HBO83905.1 glycosyl transferase family 2 [Deltaproteobacteria bacterium]